MMKKHSKALTCRSERFLADKTAQQLLTEIRALIESARAGVARAVNAGLTTLYWNVGARLRREVLGGKRADYGEQIVSAVGRQLEQRFGRGFEEGSMWTANRGRSRVVPGGR